MNTTSTRWNRLGARALATAVLVAVTGVAATTALTAQAAPGGGGHRHGGGMMAGPMMGGGFSGRMLEAVEATDEQRAQIKQIMETARGDMKAQREAGRALHEQMRSVFTQPTVDARAAEALRVQMLAQHDEASKRMMQAMLEVSRVLTPEQRAKLAELGAQRRAMMEQHRPTR
jgi:periplasmic protein CpxP/Spy